jgi:hypothetical protein
MPTGFLSTGSNHPESRPPTSNHPQHHRKGDENYLHTVISTRQNLATNTQQDWPANVVINSQVLDMQPYKVWRTTSSWSLLPIGVQPAGEEPDNMSYVWPLGSHIWQAFCKVPTRLKSGSCSRNEVLVLSDHPTRPSSWITSFYLHKTTLK